MHCSRGGSVMQWRKSRARGLAAWPRARGPKVKWRLPMLQKGHLLWRSLLSRKTLLEQGLRSPLQKPKEWLQWLPRKPGDLHLRHRERKKQRRRKKRRPWRQPQPKQRQLWRLPRRVLHQLEGWASPRFQARATKREGVLVERLQAKKEIRSPRSPEAQLEGGRMDKSKGRRPSEESSEKWSLQNLWIETSSPGGQQVLGGICQKEKTKERTKENPKEKEKGNSKDEEEAKESRRESPQERRKEKGTGTGLAGPPQLGGLEERTESRRWGATASSRGDKKVT